MSMKFSRRRIMQTAGAVALAPSVVAAAQPAVKQWPIVEGPDTPKLCLGLGDGGWVSEGQQQDGLRRIKQLGVDYVLGGGPRIPWEEADLRARIARLKEQGLTLYNLMIGGFRNTLYGGPGRDEEIEKVIASIRAAGKAGLPVIEYNFYAHRAMEGYYEQAGRAGTGYTAFDYDRMKDLPPLEREGAHSLEEMWANITYFLKAVVPVAEESGVRLALHPNVGDIRQKGLMAGIEIVADRETKERFPSKLRYGQRVIRKARDRGFILRPLGDVIVLMPPLSSTEGEIEALVDVTARAIGEVLP